LESNDWDQLDDGPLSDFGETQSAKSGDAEDFDPESLDFGVDRSDFEGLRMAIWETSRLETGEADNASSDKAKPDQSKTADATAGPTADIKDVDEEGHDLDDGMSEAQRKRLAARAVEEVMREL
jgi:hypothetical protein